MYVTKNVLVNYCNFTEITKLCNFSSSSSLLVIIALTFKYKQKNLRFSVGYIKLHNIIFCIDKSFFIVCFKFDDNRK